MREEATMKTRAQLIKCLGIMIMAMVAVAIAIGAEGNESPAFNRPATRTSISSFRAERVGRAVIVEWETSLELGTAGFELYRADSDGKRARRVNSQLLPAMLVVQQGGSYRYADKDAGNSTSLSYQLVTVSDTDEREIAARCKVLPGKTSSQSKAPVSDAIYVRTPHDNTASQLARLAVDDEAPVTRNSTRSSSTGDSVKLTVEENGVYRVSATEIASALGVTESLVSDWIADGRIEMSNRGNAVAWLGEDDNSGILFYGEGIDSIYTAKNVYWLKEGVGGHQMVELGGSAPSPVSDGLTFRETVREEQQQFATPQAFWEVGQDFWIWTYLVAGYSEYDSLTWSFNLDDPETAAGNAVVKVSLIGATDTAAAQDHHVVVYINGTEIGEEAWDGKNACVITASVSQAVLIDGNNELTMKGLLDVGASYSYVYVDSFEVSYDRKHKAVNNNLIIHDDANNVATVSGFDSAEVRVLDIADANRPSVLNAVTVSGASVYSASFNVATSESKYVAVAKEGLLTPSSIEGDTATGLTDAAKEADYVVITPAQFIAGADELASLRSGQGMDTMVIDIVDIYDEFNHGIVSPEAIKNFAAHAFSTWAKAPSYIVLVGEGSYDYKNYSGNGDCLVPSMPIRSNEGLLFSDTRLVDVDDDYAPEISIGRLPVLNSAEFEAMIDKIVAFESGGSWKSTVMMAADNPDASGDFPVLSDLAASYVPTNMQIDNVYLSEHSITDARSMIINGMNSGCSIMNYIGHGLTSKLADEGMLREEDLGSISNPDNAPIVLAMACDVGKFGISGSDTIAEALMAKTDGGAVAVWAAVGLAYSSESRILNEEFIETVFDSDFARIGDGVVAALNRYSVEASLPNLYYIYNLLGDPATVVVGDVLPGGNPGGGGASSYDFGDAPSAKYPTSLEDDGARHAFVAGSFLGSSVDAETNACVGGSASGDDLDNNDDEDGVTFTSGLLPGHATTVDVTASTTGVLNAWVDFNGDGDWADANEHVFVNTLISAGVNALQFNVPASMIERETYARFRFSSSANLLPTGEAADGEVEDYEVERTPTLATISDFDAFERDGDVVVRWETAIESGTLGFLLERQESDGTYCRVSESLVPALFGGPYEVIDPDAEAGQTYTYRLIEYEVTGGQNVYGPYTVAIASKYEEWRSEQFSTEQLADASVSGDDADADGDGHSNMQEFLAGTNPRNAASVLSLSSVIQSNDGIVLSWQSSPGKSYLVERSVESLANFEAVASVDADDSEASFTDENAPAGACFYRVQLAR